MKTKEEILDFLEKNNCNQELINDVKGICGYYCIAQSYKENGVEFTELALQALQHEKAKSGWDVRWIAQSYKENGVEFTELALQHEKAKDGWDVYKIAQEMFKEGNN